MTAQAAPTVDTTGFLLEEKQRFSQSVLWRLQRQFYHQRGPAAWNTGTVPSYVTSNPYIAQAYAHSVLAFLQSAMHRQGEGLSIDPKKPIYIIELASGPGRFAFLFLKKFLALKAASSVKHLNVKYVMTDFTENNLKSWESQPLFKDFLDAGVLEFGLFDIENDQQVRLVRSGKVLTQQMVKNPLVVIGNYIFDTVTQDLFRFEGGNAHEVLVTTRHSQPTQPDFSQPEVMSQFALSYDNRVVDSNKYYPNPDFNKVLSNYKERLSDTTIAIPIGSLVGLSRLIELSGNRMFLLSSDKGYTHEDELFFLNTQHIQFHGSLSMMVNYHAIGEYFKSLGGLYAATSQRQLNLKTVCCLLGGSEERFADALLTFREQVDVFGPYDFYTLLTQIRQNSQTCSVEELLGLIRMSHYDSNVIHEFGKDLLEQVGSLNDQLRLELHLAFERVWENFYPLGRDLPFDLARVYLAMKRPREAIVYNERSIRMFGEHPVTYSNMGICFYHAEQPQEALKCFERALQMNPNYGLPKAWRTRVLAEMDRRSSGMLALSREPKLEAKEAKDGKDGKDGKEAAEV